MYAIVDFKGQQLRMEKDKTIKVPFLADLEPGNELELDDVLLLKDDKDNVLVGQPTLDNVKIVAEVVDHGKDKKIIVFKKKRRKGYAKKQGHRQNFTTILVKDITQ